MMRAWEEMTAVKVRFHVKKEGVNHWDKPQERKLTRVPMVGEHISFSYDNSPGFKVTFVDHFALDAGDDLAAEVFAVPADYDEVRNAAGWRS
jgi:hypothetical protein